MHPLAMGVALGTLGLAPALAQVKNPGTLTTATTNSVETLDPQYMLSTANMELSSNVYDSLLAHPQSEMATLLPSLATEVPTIKNKLIKVAKDGSTSVTFHIRKGVKFHGGETLTPEDVAYTFKRGILVGAQGSSVHMLCKSFLGEDSFSDLVKKEGYDQAFARLDQMAVASGDSVTFNSPRPFVPFLALMADGGGENAIFCKSWCVAQGDWPGTRETGQKFMNRRVEDDPLHKKMNGTGPFKLAAADLSERIVLAANKSCWRGAPKLERVIRRIVIDGQTPILQLKTGDVDATAVSLDMLGQLQGAPGIKVMAKLPSAWLMKVNFVMNISPNSAYAGNGQLGPGGIPRDFFADLNVRKAFEYSFGWDAFINEVLHGAALKPTGPLPADFPTWNPKNPTYHTDLAKAKSCFQKAWKGQVWDKGFKMTFVYSAGSKVRQKALEILKNNIESLNPKFRIEMASLPWAGYIGAIKERRLPITIFGLMPTVFDPYQPLFEHMHSAGGFAEWGGYTELARKQFDPLLEVLATSYDPDKRAKASRKLQELDYEHALSIHLYQVVENVAMRDWVKGYVPGPHPTNLDFSALQK
jgi:peptide/nickel transport system substrate-binding protein